MIGPDDPVIALNAADRAEIDRLAQIRVEAQQDGNTTDWDAASPKKFELDRHEDLAESDWIGVAGEYAFAEYYGLGTPYASAERLVAGDPGYDFAIRVRPLDATYTVDVKTTDRLDGNLLHRLDLDVVADLYVLAVYDAETETVALPGFQINEAVAHAPIMRRLPVPARRIETPRLASVFPPGEVEPV